jgi:hypothetical protein
VTKEEEAISEKEKGKKGKGKCYKGSPLFLLSMVYSGVFLQCVFYTHI